MARQYMRVRNNFLENLRVQIIPRTAQSTIITRDGEPLEMVKQLGKNGFTFCLTDIYTYNKDAFEALDVLANVTLPNMSRYLSLQGAKDLDELANETLPTMFQYLDRKGWRKADVLVNETLPIFFPVT